MIRSYKRMQGSRIHALDGDIGKLKDIYFDDLNWTVKYFVIELGPWFSGKEVLVSPPAVASFDGAELQVELTKAEIKACPGSEDALPVSLQQQYKARYLFELVSGVPGHLVDTPIVVPLGSTDDDQAVYDPHLRSCAKISNYQLLTNDTCIGTVHDILIDDALWLIRFFVAGMDETNENHRIVIGPQLVKTIEWSLSTLSVALTKEEVMKKPIFKSKQYLDTSYESMLTALLGKQR